MFFLKWPWRLRDLPVTYRDPKRSNWVKMSQIGSGELRVPSNTQPNSQCRSFDLKWPWPLRDLPVTSKGQMVLKSEKMAKTPQIGIWELRVGSNRLANFLWRSFDLRWPWPLRDLPVTPRGHQRSKSEKWPKRSKLGSQGLGSVRTPWLTFYAGHFTLSDLDLYVTSLWPLEVKWGQKLKKMTKTPQIWRLYFNWYLLLFNY